MTGLPKPSRILHKQPVHRSEAYCAPST
jgi:hypothetical protein